ncbi:hypothetical protein F443_02567 [Phytophthora nicotianae P1569]|uniref:Uncharacterized protein n=2 Tax=Phytophthora nicotianae TaxID=4792 RepID=V9FT52_PHYNI|nr:hypothetical protein F443_02567 [Phytophthora nicotianae P1569]
MPPTTTTTTTTTTTMTTKTFFSPMAGSPTKSPLSVQRPTLSPRKRKFSDASAATPTSLDEVSASSSSADELVISPKKKAKAEERASSDLSKWESHVVASIASALDLDGMTADDDAKGCCSSNSNQLEPVAFSAVPAGDLATDELQILRHFLV